MKQILKFAVAFTAALAMMAGTAYALTSLTFSPTGLVEVSTFPHNRNISGTFTHTGEHGDENLCKNSNGTTWELWVEDESGTTLTLADQVTPAYATGQYLRTAGSPPVCAAGTSKTETLTGVRFLEPGVYTIKGTLETNQGNGIEFADEGTLELAYEQEVIVTYPAAPSVAAQILADAEQSARYGSGKTGGNHIADVAAEMSKSKGTDFMGIAKKDVEAYREAVLTFLRTKSNPASV